jgi:metal-responsive CopG/Arc/MetJ family transcriptional regulator
MTTLTVQCPDQLAEQLDKYVGEGGVTDRGEALIEALRRFLESHRPDIARTQVLADVEWGLHGSD